MTPRQFVEKWRASTLGERQGAQSHFRDLCDLIGRPHPDDPERYTFEKGAEKTGGGGGGFADVWRKGCFGWEYKGRGADLGAALRQLQAYALDLQNPPYLVVSDMARVEVHTNWTNTVSKTYAFSLDDLLVPDTLNLLRQVFDGSEALKPGVSPQELTATVARVFGDLGRRLQERRDPAGALLHHPQAIAHFLNRLVFCMFAEDAGLLPPDLFTRLVQGLQKRPAAESAGAFDALFASMRAGGMYGADIVRWFNGGLFDAAPALALERPDLKLIADTAAEHDWSQIDPAIFGALFEEALKVTGRRPALGAHYTDREKILKIVEPVIVRPLEAEWAQALADIRGHVAEREAAEAERRATLTVLADKLDPADADRLTQAEAARLRGGANLELFEDVGARRLPTATRAAIAAARPALDAAAHRAATAGEAARARLDAYLERLAAFRVLDPACGSGNFLYVALHALKDLERRAQVDAEREAAIPQAAPRVGLQCVRGIEIEAYAAELARVTLWIGDLQWNAANSYTGLAEPILSSLDQIECRDALLNEDGSEAEWPGADVIVGNPPFVGGKRLRTSLGDAVVERLFKAYDGRVPREADFVCYWVEKAWRSVSLPRSREGQAGAAGQGGPAAAASFVETRPPDPALRPGHPPDKREGEEAGGTRRAGLVTTNSVRGGANRRVLDPIAESGALMEAWADQPWTQEGAAVRVSMIGFGEGFVDRRLEGLPAERINADLTGGGVDLTKAARLKENAGVAFSGPTKKGKFEISGEQARVWLTSPTNPNGKRNSDVLRPWWNGDDVTRRNRGEWIIDFGELSETEAALYETPFDYVRLIVQPFRARSRDANEHVHWWRLARRAPALAKATEHLIRVIVTPEVSKHRTFVWASPRVLADKNLVVFARDDDASLGVLHSSVHRIWSSALGTSLEDRPRYTSRSTVRTFPFPEGLTPNIPAADYADDPRARAIAEAAADLNAKREAWLNPPDLVRVVPEVVPGYPHRILPIDEAVAVELKKRTLTNLYNARPAWLDMAHRRLDAAVAAAYGWTDWGEAGLPDAEILARLFALNQARAAAGR